MRANKLARALARQVCIQWEDSKAGTLLVNLSFSEQQIYRDIRARRYGRANVRLLALKLSQPS